MKNPLVAFVALLFLLAIANSFLTNKTPDPMKLLYFDPQSTVASK